MRFINTIVTANPDKSWSNQEFTGLFSPHLNALDVDKEKATSLRQALHFFLYGERARRCVPDFYRLRTFQNRAQAFETGADQLLDRLADGLIPRLSESGVVFDGIITTTSTGNLMPGLSYRMAQRLKSHVRTDAMMIDLGNAGCTGSLKALNLAASLESRMSEILVVSVELPSTLVNLTSESVDVWQGNCTFGDGAAALWVSGKPAETQYAAQIETIRTTHETADALDLIHWDYQDYYTFRLRDHETFDRETQTIIARVMNTLEPIWRNEAAWAIHPAGLALMVRIFKILDIPREKLTPSLDSYNRYSNMSSAGIFFILRDILQTASSGTGVNLLSMGAGFDVVYGLVRKR